MSSPDGSITMKMNDTSENIYSADYTEQLISSTRKTIP